MCNGYPLQLLNNTRLSISYQAVTNAHKNKELHCHEWNISEMR